MGLIRSASLRAAHCADRKMVLRTDKRVRSKNATVLILLFVAVTIGIVMARHAYPSQHRHVSVFSSTVATPGPVDVGFAQNMAMHHDQAVLMAQILISHGTSSLGGLAMSMQTTQLLQIGQMQGWLILWGEPTLPSERGMDWMLKGRQPADAALINYAARCRDAGGGMPGLASTEELNELREKDGQTRDRLFLQLMIRHHEAALPMARFAAANADTAVVRTLAAKIVFDQTQEIGRLQTLLATS